MSTVIKVENLSKKYIIGHRKQERYITLRDVITNNVRKLGSKLLHPFAVKAIEDNPYREEIWALKDVSFEAEQGERIGIIGRNGAGKTTLLKVLSRITEPTKGRVSIKGRVASLLEVGTGFHSELSGRENIYLNGAILGMSKAEIKKKFDEIVAFAEIEKFLDTPVKRYSSGMYVRLAFAVAAHLEPEILLVDEVLAVGDAAFQKKCLGKMDDVAKEGRTILFVSHNMGAIQRLCPQTIWLERGQVKEVGESTTICEKYLYSDIEFVFGAHTFSDGAGYAVQFLRAELLNAQDKPTSVFRADEPIKFRITYRLTHDLEGVSVSLNICTATGESLWSVADWDIFPELFEKRKAGIWVYECLAPAHVLRPGRYLVALGAGSITQSFHHPTLFPFEITTAGYWRQSHRYFGVVGGPVVVPMQVTRPVECK